jgi:hypothetical protein
MHSQQSFTPGKKSGTSRVIKYVAAYNALYPNSPQLNCKFCAPDTYDKFVIGSDSPSVRVSNYTRVSQIINYSKGGKTQYGNFYLGQPLNLNYLGRMEGMPGGSGSSPKNAF